MMRWMMVTVAVAGLLSMSCDRDDGEEEKPAPVGLEEFDAEVVDAVCEAYAECDNEPIMGAMTTLLLAALAGDIAEGGARPVEPEVAEIYREIVERLNDEKRVALPAEECEDFAEMLLVHEGYAAHQLRGIVGNAEGVFDAGRAGECVDALRDPFEVCGEADDFPLPEVDMTYPEAMLLHFRLVLKDNAEEMDALFSSCEGIVEGKMPAGGPCRFDHQCANGASCAWVRGEEQGECAHTVEEESLVP